MEQALKTNATYCQSYVKRNVSHVQVHHKLVVKQKAQKWHDNGYEVQQTKRNETHNERCQYSVDHVQAQSLTGTYWELTGHS